MAVTEVIELVFEILTCVCSITSIGFVIAGFKKSNQIRRDDLDHARKIATLEAYSQLQKEALDILYTQYEPKDIRAIVEGCRRNEFKEEYRKLSTYIARIEHFSVGVENNIYDRKTVNELAKGFLDGTIKERIMPVIDKKDSYNDGKFYENTRKMLERMESEE